MSVTGLDKFAHLEDKIRLAVEMCKSLRQEKEALERELEKMRILLTESDTDRERLRGQIERLQIERESMKRKVEEMLDAIATLEMEAESLNR
jgi:chromosome segregation ATPase